MKKKTSKIDELDLRPGALNNTCTVADQHAAFNADMLRDSLEAMRATFRSTMEEQAEFGAEIRNEIMTSVEVRERYREYFTRAPRDAQARDRFSSPLADPRRVAARITEREDEFQRGRIYRIAMPPTPGVVYPHGPETADETMDVLEFRVFSERAPPELVHAGWMRGANPRIMQGVNRVLYALIQNRDAGPAYRRDRDMLPNNAKNFLHAVRTAMTRQYGALNAMAEDNCWPLFWFLIARNSDSSSKYNRDTAGKVIDGFKEQHKLSNADWKFLCQQSPAYLYLLFEGGTGYNIRWPNISFIEAWREIPGRPHKKPLAEFLRRVSRDDPAFAQQNPRDFGYVLRDYFDLASGTRGVPGQEIMDKVLRSKTWAQFCDRLRAQEAGAHRQNPFYRQMLHLVDPFATHRMDLASMERLMMSRYGLFGDPRSTKPEMPTPFAWMSFLPPEIEGKSFKAVILRDDAALYAEGQEKMEHCIFRLYKSRIEKGDYIGVHIVADHLDKNGFTLGLGKMREGERAWWKVDQIRGKRNGTSQDKGLHAFGDVVCRKINELWKEHDDAKK